jgi:hypothetical protein
MTIDTLSSTLANLRAICGVGITELRGWAEYTIPPATAMIVARPQVAFRPERLVLPPDRAHRWRIHDIKVGGKSQLAQQQPLPGDVFSAAETNTTLTIEPIVSGMDLSLEVEYVGDVADGEDFIASVIGVGLDGGPRRMAIPLSSAGQRVRAVDCGRRVLIDLEGCVYRFEERRGKLDRIVVVSPDDLTRLYRIDREANDLGIEVRSVGPIKPPRVIALRAETLAHEPRLVLFGVDEASDRVVFEISDKLYSFEARCELDGYVPTWFQHLDDPAIVDDAIALGS